MEVLDAGHRYLLRILDGKPGDVAIQLRFVKREGAGYPGNVGAYPGTTLQECWRAEIARLLYLQEQNPCMENTIVIDNLRANIRLLEARAARRHGRPIPDFLEQVEKMSVCPQCGHVGCEETC